MSNNILAFFGCVLLISCELNRTTQIYNPGFIIEKFYEVPLGWEMEDGDSESFHKIMDTTSNNYRPMLVANYGSSPVLKQNVTLFDSGSYFIVGKFKAEIDTGSFFINATTDWMSKEITFNSNTDICLRALFSINISKKTDLKLEIGFKSNSIGKAYPEVLYINNEKYFYKLDFDTRDIKKGLKRITGISEFNQEEFDNNIDKIAEILAGAFLAKNDSLIDFFSSDIFNIKQSSYLYGYASDTANNESASQMCSLSLDEILKIYRIPVRQLSWQQNCSGIHQFIEYWNPFDKKWKIIDPYFGLRYVNEENEYMDFEEVEKRIRSNTLKTSNIVKVTETSSSNTRTAIIDGWKTNELAVFIIRK